jgi:hypothetical protein
VSDNLTHKSIQAYEKIEISFDVRAKILNPYDPRDISVSVRFISPKKKSFDIRAFYFVPHKETMSGNKAVFSRTGTGSWCARFTPGEKGAWSYSVRAAQNNKRAETKAAVFTVSSGTDKGFIRTKKGSRYFQFDSGEVFLPIGMNVSWYDNRGMAAYETWFKSMAENGANFARIWMASWGFAQEWSDTGLGQYEERQGRAAELDTLFALAEKYDICLMLCLNNHGQYSSLTNPEWNHNPYNSAKGGVIDKPKEFLTSEKAKALFKQRLAYIAARWGYSTHLFAWEWWNEVDLTEGLADPSILVPWMSEMKKYLESIEPYGHLVSSSYSSAVNGKEEAWSRGGLDFVQVHAYNKQDWASYFTQTASVVERNAGKPLLFGEFGINSETFIDPDGIHFHDGLYAGVFSGSAGTGMIWWWDTYIEPKNLFHHFKGLREFFKADTNFLPATKSSIIADPEADGSVLGAYALLGPKRSFVWVRSNSYYYGCFMDQALENGIANVEFPLLSGKTISIPVSTPGLRTIEIWDPEKSSIIGKTEKQAKKTVDIELPPFSKDLLLKVY